MRQARTIQLGIAIQGDAPPDRFRVFTSPTVVTSKGVFIFDAEAAAAVMADYAEQGNELMVDYDHASLAAMSVDPALSARAAGWFGLELADDGSLWAVNVRWTAPAAEALSRKEWRYMSPAFCTDGDRIVSLMNVALTNMPATRRLQPLMAANRKEHRMSGPTLEQWIKIRDVLELPPESTMEELMGAVGAQPPAAPLAEPAPEAAEPEAEAMAETEPPADEAKPEDEEEKPEAAALVVSSRVAELTGKTTAAGKLQTIAVWKASHIELESVRQQSAAEKALRDAAEYRRISVDRVKLGKVAPTLVWETPDANSPPKRRWLAMSLADYADVLADEIKVAGKGGAPRAPVFASEGSALSEREVAMLADQKATPEQIQIYAARKAANAKKAS